MSLSEIGMLYTQRQDLGRNWIQSKVTTWSLFSTGIFWTVNGYNSDQSPDAVYSLLIKNSRQSVIYLKNILSNPSSSETILNQSSLLRSELIPNTPYILPQTHSIPQLQLSSIYPLHPIYWSYCFIIHPYNPHHLFHNHPWFIPPNPSPISSTHQQQFIHMTHPCLNHLPILRIDYSSVIQERPSSFIQTFSIPSLTHHLHIFQYPLFLNLPTYISPSLYLISNPKSSKKNL